MKKLISISQICLCIILSFCALDFVKTFTNNSVLFKESNFSILISSATLLIVGYYIAKIRQKVFAFYQIAVFLICVIILYNFRWELLVLFNGQHEEAIVLAKYVFVICALLMIFICSIISFIVLTRRKKAGDKRTVPLSQRKDFFDEKI